MRSWRIWELGAALVAVTCVAYYPAMQGGFILDDDLLLTESPFIAGANGLWKFWFTFEPADYYPVSNTDLWLEWRLFGNSPAGYHITNLLLHVATSLLLWLLLTEIFSPPDAASKPLSLKPKFAQAAYLAALLFAVHPVNVESVAWIAQRKDILALFFFLVSVWSYLIADDRAQSELASSGTAQQPTAHVALNRWYWLSLLAYVLAMLSKGSVAIGPLILLLLMWWRQGRVTLKDLKCTIPFFVVAAGLTAITVVRQAHETEGLVRSADLLERILRASGAVWFYLSKAIYPVDLHFVYPQWTVSAADWRWWMSLAAAAGLTAFLFWQRATRFARPAWFAWCFYCVALIPSLGFVHVGFMKYSLVADHYQHLALIAPVTLFAVGWNYWAQCAAAWVRPAATLIAPAAVAILTVLTWRQCDKYSSPIRLYEATIAANPDCWMPHFRLAFELDQAGRKDEARRRYEEAIRLNPTNAEIQSDLGVLLAKNGDLEGAIKQLKQATQCDPQFVDARLNLANALRDSGDLPGAIEHYRQAISLKQNDAFIRNNLANALANAGELPEAIEQYGEAIKRNPDLAESYNNLALALVRSGRTKEAAENYEHALEIKPDYPEAHNNYGDLLRQTGSLPKAIEHFQEALKTLPNSPVIHNNLGLALLASGRPRDAIQQFEQATRLAPDYLDAYANLWSTQVRLGYSREALDTAEKTLSIARSAGQTALAQQIESWLARHRSQPLQPN